MTMVEFFIFVSVIILLGAAGVALAHLVDRKISDLERRRDDK